MTYDEKEQLSLDLHKLPSDELGHIMHMCRTLEPSLRDGDPDAVEIDFEKLEPSTLRELEYYVACCLGRIPQKSENGKLFHPRKF